MGQTIMIKLNVPGYTFLESIEQCIQGITGNNSLAAKAFNSKNALDLQNINYLNLSQTGDLYTIRPITTEEEGSLIGNLTKPELVKLYDTYFVKKEKPARSIYNALILAANEQCPFCGGIGRPRNLDHYLPKTHFPYFSVAPNNLIPSCRDCNMDGKGSSFANTKSEQIIHPYLDNLQFFNEQWIFASYTPDVDSSDEPGTFVYFVDPPEHWSEDDKNRVITHFNNFDLAVRFATKASEELTICINQIDLLIEAGLTTDLVKQTLVDPVVNKVQFVNHWRRAMYQALADAILV